MTLRISAGAIEPAEPFAACIGMSFEVKLFAVKILNARYHAFRRGGTRSTLVVARVYCDAHGLSLEPIQSALENTRPMLELRWILERAGPHTYESLLGFNTARWTFESSLCDP